MWRGSSFSTCCWATARRSHRWIYQRMLAGDPDEVHDHAEVLLKQMPLASYYDDVALEGLRLAVIDTERGALTAEHLEEIKLCLQSLIEDLDEHTDQPPAVGAARGAQ